MSKVVQVFAPAGERWKATEATPEPASVAPAVATIVPRRFAAAIGEVRAPAGAVLSTRTFATVALVPGLPAASVTITRRS